PRASAQKEAPSRNSPSPRPCSPHTGRGPRMYVLYVTDAPRRATRLVHLRYSLESGSLHRRLPDPVLADSETRRTAPLAADTHFVDVLQEVGRIFIDAIRAGTLEFVLAVAAGQETNAKGSGALRS